MTDAGSERDAAPDAAPDPWAALPESVRVVPGTDGVRRAFVSERLWMSGTDELPDLLVQRLVATMRTTGVDVGVDFHADLRGFDEETRAWALEIAHDLELVPAI